MFYKLNCFRFFPVVLVLKKFYQLYNLVKNLLSLIQMRQV